jgi:putative addiction module CopG family antidote
MSRDATINVSLTPEQLKLVRARVRSGEYHSASELVRESLRQVFGNRAEESPRRSLLKEKLRAARKNLASAYKATAATDRKTAQEWSNLNDQWPDA